MTEPIRNTTMINRVNSSFQRSSGTFQAFRIVLNNSDHLGLPTGSFNLLLCSFGESAYLNGQVFGQRTVAQDFHPVAALLNQTSVNQSLGIYHRPILKSFQRANIDGCLLYTSPALRNNPAKARFAHDIRVSVH